MALFRHLRAFRSLPKNFKSSHMFTMNGRTLGNNLGRVSSYCNQALNSPDLLRKYEYILSHMETGDGVSTDREDRYRVILNADTEDYFLKELHSVTTVQQVFDVIDVIPAEERTPEHSAQALVSLWDMQKLILAYNPQAIADSDQIPVPGDASSYSINFVRALIEHPKYLEIKQHVLQSYRRLGEVALGAVLVVFQKLLHQPRDPECQLLIQELLARKNHLTWPTLSRLATIFKSRNDTYAKQVQVELLPRVYELLGKMTTDEDIRCASIFMRFCRQIVSRAIVTRYRDRLEQLHEENIYLPEFPVTSCKIILAVLSTLYIEEGRNSSQLLINRYCKALMPELGEVRKLDLLYLSIELHKHKACSTEFQGAIGDQVNHLAEVCPHPFVISCVNPKTPQQRIRLNQYLKEFMSERPKHFRVIAWNLYRILQYAWYEADTWNLFWSLAMKHCLVFTYNPRIQEELNLRSAIRGTKFDLSHEEFLDGEDDGVVDGTDHDDKNWSFKAIMAARWARAYTSALMQAHGRLYHDDFEQELAGKVVVMLRQYKEAPYQLAPNDYLKLLAFLVAIRWSNWPEFVIPGMINNAEAKELNALGRAINLSQTYRGVNDSRSYQAQVSLLADMMIKSVENFWEYPADSLSDHQIVNLSNVALHYHTMYRTNPIVASGFQSLISRKLNSNSANIAMMLFCSTGSIHSAEAFQRVSDFICENAEHGNVDVVIPFTTASFRCASDVLDGHEVAARIIERHYDNIPFVSLLHAMVAMSYHRCLPVNLVNKVFSVDFIDSLDMFLQNQRRRYLTDRARFHFMELNRAVCLDMPEANVPWFHETFCRDYSEIANRKKTHIHNELRGILRDIYGYGYIISEDKYSPYYYFIDFLIEPVKKYQVPEASQDREKVAVLVRRPEDFTVYTKRLKGQVELSARHLEILGYKVINIDPYVWNSMHMSEQSAKRNFLLAQINATK